MNYSISKIAEILRLPRPAFPDIEINCLLTDSRSLDSAEDSLFFAIRTPAGDGHNYIESLYRSGVRNFVVESIPAEMADVDDVNFLKMTDPRKALQTVARYHRLRFNVPVIGITGSRGKTTVKEWLYNLLNSDFNIVRSPRSFNSQIGVPLSIWEMDDSTDLAIFEAGISRPDEMATLEKMIAPEIGIVTNIGDEHSEGFSSLKEKCDEKIALFRNCDCIIYNGDDRVITESVDNAVLPAKEIAWSRTDSNRPLYIYGVERNAALSTTIRYSYLGVDGAVTIPFTTDADIENAINCLAVMLYLNRPFDTIAQRMGLLSPVGTRMDVIEGVNDCRIIHDSYTSDFNSLMPALDFLERRTDATRSKTVILSDLMHESLVPDRLYREVATLLRRHNISRLLAVGPEISAHSRYFGADSRFFTSTEEFLAEMSANDFDRELILIKGAPAFEFDRINDMLEGRQHETILEVNLDSIVHNYNFFRSKIRPSTGIICMVKASGYGAGSYELARTLQSHNATYLAVAALDEGVELRRSGITMPILVLNPKVVNYRTLFAYNLEPEIYSFEILDRIINEARKCGITGYPVHIKLDTGMHRLGFLEEDITRLKAVLQSQDAITPVTVFSHLAAADSPQMDDYTFSQFEYFNRCCDALQEGFDHRILRHILNSTGIIRFPEHQLDLVRLGIGLYGIKTLDDGSQEGLRQVSSLRSVIISIKEWPEWTTIGYSRRGVLSRRSRIATIPIGYADGLDRHLGNGHFSVMVNGRRCPTVGNICMDICMIDVTDVDCKPGDKVEIFGPEIPVEELSDILDTIPYEILTSVSSRVKRVYFRE